MVVLTMDYWLRIGYHIIFWTESWIISHDAHNDEQSGYLLIPRTTKSITREQLVKITP